MLAAQTVYQRLLPPLFYLFLQAMSLIRLWTAFSVLLSRMEARSLHPFRVLLHYQHWRWGAQRSPVQATRR